MVVPGVTYANFSQKNYLDTSAFSALNVFPIGGTIPCASLGDTSFDAKYGKGVCGNAITKIGTAPRSSSYLRQPSRYNVDASLQRSFPISKERVKFVFRADCFNVLNNVTFSMAQTQTISVVNPSATSLVWPSHRLQQPSSIPVFGPDRLLTLGAARIASGNPGGHSFYS